MNPLKLMKLRHFKQTFEKNHPRFFPFLKVVSKNALQEGTLVNIQITTPNGKTYKSNLKLIANDIEMLKELNKAIQASHNDKNPH